MVRLTYSDIVNLALRNTNNVDVIVDGEVLRPRSAHGTVHLLLVGKRFRNLHLLLVRGRSSATELGRAAAYGVAHGRGSQEADPEKSLLERSHCDCCDVF